MKAVRDTQQITKAMKMVSAAKLRRAQDAIIQVRPYANKLGQILRNLLENVEGEYSLDLTEEREVKNVLIVVVTSDRGLCGSFNSNLIKMAGRLLNEKYAKQHEAGTVKLLPIGKRGYEYFKRRNVPMNSDFYQLFNELNFDNTSKIAQYLIDSFTSKEFDVVEVVYSKFKNAATQIYTNEEFLPVKKVEEVQQQESSEKKIAADYIFEPSKEAIIKELFPRILRTEFHRSILDTNASEHGARMTAMDKASDNCNELIGELRISYNRARQEAITKELSEIVGGAAALEG